MFRNFILKSGAACILSALPAMAFSNVPGGDGDHGNVTLSHHGEDYDLANGNVTAVIHGPDATIISLRYHGTEFVNKVGNHEQIYWSMDGGTSYENPHGAVCTVKTNTTEMADIG